MLSLTALREMVVVMYVWLAACIAYGRPPWPRHGSDVGPSRVVGEGRATYESAWLVLVAVVAASPLALLLVPPGSVPSFLTFRFPGETGAQIAGLLVVMVAGALVGSSFRALGRFATVRIRVWEDHSVVRRGPYRYIRHPMYSAVMLLAIGVTVTLLSAPVAALTAAIMVLAHLRARSEEELFLATPSLRGEYAKYIATTGRFMPVVFRPGK